jgi:hypothetical protein
VSKLYEARGNFIQWPKEDIRIEVAEVTEIAPVHPTERVNTPSSPMHTLKILVAPALAPQLDSDDEPNESMPTSMPRTIKTIESGGDELEITSPIKKLEAPPLAPLADETPKVIVPSSVDKKKPTMRSMGKELTKAPLSKEGTKRSNPRQTGGTETMKVPLSKEGTRTSTPKPSEGALLLTAGPNMLTPFAPIEIGGSPFAYLNKLVNEQIKKPKSKQTKGITVRYRPCNCTFECKYVLAWDELSAMPKVTSMGDNIVKCFAL